MEVTLKHSLLFLTIRFSLNFVIMLMKDAKLIVVETDRLYPQSRHSIGSENKSFPLNVLLINLTRELGPVQGFSRYTLSILCLSAKLAR